MHACKISGLSQSVKVVRHWRWQLCKGPRLLRRLTAVCVRSIQLEAWASRRLAFRGLQQGVFNIAPILGGADTSGRGGTAECAGGWGAGEGREGRGEACGKETARERGVCRARQIYSLYQTAVTQRREQRGFKRESGSPTRHPQRRGSGQVASQLYQPLWLKNTLSIYQM